MRALPVLGYSPPFHQKYLVAQKAIAEFEHELYVMVACAAMFGYCITQIMDEYLFVDINSAVRLPPSGKLVESGIDLVAVEEQPPWNSTRYRK